MIRIIVNSETTNIEKIYAVCKIERNLIKIMDYLVKNIYVKKHVFD